MFHRIRRRVVAEHDLPESVAALDAAEPTTETRNRRGLIAAVLAGGAVIAVGQRSGTALAAHQPEDVALGAVNTTSLPTTITRTGGGSTLILSNPSSGIGLLVNPGCAYGVDANGSGAGVLGQATSPAGYGVIGQGAVNSAVGVGGYAQGSAGAGVVGSNAAGAGVVGFTGSLIPTTTWPAHVAVVGRCTDDTGLGASFSGGRAPMRLLPNATAGAPTTGAHDVGEIIIDSTGVLYYCRTDGTPGTWIRVDAPSVSAPSGPVLHILSTPERFVDTRSSLGGVAGPVPAVTSHTFVMTGRVGETNNPALQIPDTATTLVGNFTVIGASGVSLGSFATLWPSGPKPAVSNINFGPLDVTGAVANSFTVGVDSSSGHGSINVYNHSACDYILDVTGYYTAS